MFYSNFLDINIISNQFTLTKPKENAKEIVKIINNSTCCFNLFPELSLTGYTLEDTLFDKNFLNEVNAGLNYILENTKTKSINIIGLPIKLNNTYFNCALLSQGKKILGVVPKSFIPNYKEFNEGNYYLSGLYNKEDNIKICDQLVPFGYILFNDKENNVKFGVEICEDMWVKLSPSTYYANKGADIIFNLSATTSYVYKEEIRDTLLKDISRRNNVAYIYASLGLNEKLTNTLFQNCLVAYSCGKCLFKEYTYTKNTIFKQVGIDLNKIRYEKCVMTHKYPCAYFDNKALNIKEVLVNLEKTNEYHFHQSILEDNKDLAEIKKMYKILIENKFGKDALLFVRKGNEYANKFIQELHKNIIFTEDKNIKAINLSCQSEIIRNEEYNKDDYYIFANLTLTDLKKEFDIDDFVIYRIFDCHDDYKQIKYLLNYLNVDYDLDEFINKIKKNMSDIKKLNLGIRIHDYSILDNKDLMI